jgi:kynurenine formamidase
VLEKLGSTPLRAQKIEISPERIVDLTYDFDATTVYWPNAKSFDWQKEYRDMSPRGYCDAAGHYSASEHGGMVHAVILGSGLYGLENVAHADRLLPPGATIIALPNEDQRRKWRAYAYYRGAALVTGA